MLWLLPVLKARQSTTTSPLLDLLGSTVVAGGINPFTETLASTYLLGVVSSVSSNTSGSPASITLAGPVLSATGSTIRTTNGTVGVFNGATFSSTTTLPLVRLDSSRLTNPFANLFSNDVIEVASAGGPSGNGFSTASLNGPLLTATNGSVIDITGSLAAVFQGGSDHGVRVHGSLRVAHRRNPYAGDVQQRDPDVQSVRSGRRHRNRYRERVDSGYRTGRIQGPVQQDGTRPIRASLLETSGASVTGPSVVAFDRALVEASAPLLNARSASVVTTSTDAVILGT